MFDVDFYKTESGKCPIEEYLDSLDQKLRAKTLRSITILEEFTENTVKGNRKSKKM